MAVLGDLGHQASNSAILLAAQRTDPSAALLAQDLADNNLSSGLPANQWQLEVTRWFQTSLSKLQSLIVQFARIEAASFAGFATLREPAFYGGEPPAFRQALQSQCGNQRVQSAGQVQSFSALGLFLVVGITVLLGVVALLLEKCINLTRRGLESRAETALQADEGLHLLRMVLEGTAREQDKGSSWRLSTLGVPICDIDTAVDRPTLSTNRLSTYRSESESNGMTHFA